MNRRAMIAMVLVATAAPLGARAQLRDDDVKGYVSLSEAFLKILTSLNTVADIIDGARFKDALSACLKALTAVKLDKHDLRLLLLSSPCPSQSVLAKATEKLGKDLGKLRDKARTLSEHVGAAELRREVERAVSHFEAIHETKTLWLPDVERYCGLDVRAKATVRIEIGASLAAASQCFEDGYALFVELKKKYP